MELHFFDLDETAAILYRKLPHWSQAGVVCFITFRTDDSMPLEVVEGWHRDRRSWLSMARGTRQKLRGLCIERSGEREDRRRQSAEVRRRSVLADRFRGHAKSRSLAGLVC